MEPNGEHRHRDAEMSEPGSKMDILQQLKDSETLDTEEPQLQLVVISFDNTFYGIQLLSVREILKVPKITWLPCSPDFIAGVISVRGNIQSVVNLKAFLSLGTLQITDHSRIILVESEELTTGLLVDEMIDIITVPESSLVPLSDMGSISVHRYLEGKLSWNNTQLTLLNIDTIVQGVVVDQA